MAIPLKLGKAILPNLRFSGLHPYSNTVRWPIYPQDSADEYKSVSETLTTTHVTAYHHL